MLRLRDKDIRRIERLDQWIRNFKIAGPMVRGKNTGQGASYYIAPQGSSPQAPPAKPVQYAIIVCEGVCRNPDGSMQALPDFKDNRYWLRLARVINSGGSSCDPVQLGFYPAGDRRDITVAATNLAEDNCRTHLLRPGTRVTVDFAFDRSTPPQKRWTFNGADEGTCREGPCKPPSSSSSASSTSSSSTSSSSSATSSSSSSGHVCVYLWNAYYNCGVWQSGPVGGGDTHNLNAPDDFPVPNRNCAAPGSYGPAGSWQPTGTSPAGCVYQYVYESSTPCAGEDTSGCGTPDISHFPPVPNFSPPHCPACSSSSSSAPSSSSSAAQKYCLYKFVCSWDCTLNSGAGGFPTPTQVPDSTICDYLGSGYPTNWTSADGGDCNWYVWIVGNPCSDPDGTEGCPAYTGTVFPPTTVPVDCCPSSSSQSSSSEESSSSKSTAIVPASWSPTGYTALFVQEAPEVRFDDVLVATVMQKNCSIAIDPRFLEVCHAGSVEVCGCQSDQAVAIGARVKGGKVMIRFGRSGRKRHRVVIRLTGIRKGFAGQRFPSRTKDQFDKNERFINSAY